MLTTAIISILSLIPPCRVKQATSHEPLPYHARIAPAALRPAVSVAPRPFGHRQDRGRCRIVPRAHPAPAACVLRELRVAGGVHDNAGLAHGVAQ